MSPWGKKRGTVIRIDNVEDIKIRVVDDGREPPEFHFVSVGMSGQFFCVDCGFRNVEKSIDEWSLSWVLVAEDDHGCVIELALCPWLIQKLIPHLQTYYL